jgi:multiple sugar transport system substrate-binding protein
MIALRGMTWDHSRGFDPMVATSELFAARHPQVRISWEKRSLQDFEQFPVEQLAAEYDLIVIDHPHIGGLADAGILLPFDWRDPRGLQALADNSVGPSFPSYRWKGQHWALPIDAAAQVQAWRADLIDAPLTRWDDVVAQARQGRVLWPLRSPHQLMSFMTLSANRGTPCATVSGALLAQDDAIAVLEVMRELACLVPAECHRLDPIAVLEALAAEDQWAVAPLTYGYVSYASDGFRRKPVRFADLAALGSDGPSGSVIGGTGLAISAKCAHPDIAFDYAYFTASEDVQRGAYVQSGGQAGHRAAWLDPAINQAVHGFYRDTLATLDRSWLRPRHQGYLKFQVEGSKAIDRFLDGSIGATEAARELDRLYLMSWEAVD